MAAMAEYRAAGFGWRVAIDGAPRCRSSVAARSFIAAEFDADPNQPDRGSSFEPGAAGIRAAGRWLVDDRADGWIS